MFVSPGLEEAQELIFHQVIGEKTKSVHSQFTVAGRCVSTNHTTRPKDVRFSLTQYRISPFDQPIILNIPYLFAVMNSTTCHPSLPPLYFGEPCSTESAPALSAAGCEERNNKTTRRGDADTNSSNDVRLPAELIHQCLVEYSDWGDLAKLACVKQSWKYLVQDAAAQNATAKWSLAQSLLQGTCGLQTNANLALKYLLQLSNIDFDEESKLPMAKSKQLQLPFTPAMREIANCFLTGTGVVKDSEKGVAWLKASYM